MISVVMSTYDEPLRLIEQSVGSILNQTYKDFEFIIIVDNPSRKELVDFLKNQQGRDERVRVFVNKKNIGLTASLNKGIKVAHGKYIARMDADDIARPNRLEKQLQFIKKNDLDLIGSNILDIDMNGRPTSGKMTCYPENDVKIKKYLRLGSPMAHPTWFGKSDVFKENIYIDFPACEDYEFLTRVALAGKKLGNVNEVLLDYRINENGISNSKRIMQKTSLYFVRKNYRNNKLSDYNDFIEFLNSAAGRKKQGELEKYYKMNKVLKNDLKNKLYFSFAYKAIILWFMSPIMREKVYGVLRLNGIRSKNG